MNSIYDSPKETCTKILSLDESIRFVGRIKDRKLVTFVRREGLTPLLDDELGNMAHYQASFKASMEDMFDNSLGKTNWMITSKEYVTLITVFLDDGLLILSTESDADPFKIIRDIQTINKKL